MKKVFLINTSQLPCPGSHYLHTIKFLKSFSYFGYEFIEIHKIEEVISYEDSPDNIFYIADHGFHINNQPNEIDILSRFKNSVFFLWHLHYNLEFLSKKLNKWILTGEHYRKEPESPGHKKSYDLQNSLKNYVPLTFAANSHPDEIKLKENFDNYKYDCNYVGCAYNPDWIGHIQQHLKCFIRFTPPFISEEDRINSFKDSLCSLGFQSPNNLINSS